MVEAFKKAGFSLKITLFFALVFSLAALYGNNLWARQITSTASYEKARALYANEQYFLSVDVLINFMKYNPADIDAEDASYLAGLIIEHHLSDEEFEFLQARALLSNAYMDSMRKLRNGKRVESVPDFGLAIIRSVKFTSPKEGTKSTRCVTPAPPSGLEPDIIVSSRIGSDERGDGKCRAFRSITAALKNLSPDSVVWVAPGVYSADNGERFPIFLPKDVSLIGDVENKGKGAIPTVIKGSGYVITVYHTAVYANEGTTVSGFTFKSASGKSGMDFGILSQGTDITVRDNTFTDIYGGYAHFGGSPIVSGNIFDTLKYEICSRCLDKVFTPVLKGRIKHDGELVWNISKTSPKFWFRNEKTGQSADGYAEYKEGHYEVSGLSPGRYGMSVFIDLNSENPREYPGDLRTWTGFDVTDNGTTTKDVNLTKLIHMVKPQDNGKEMEKWGAKCEEKISFKGPVVFEWKPVAEGVTYDYSISRGTCKPFSYGKRIVSAKTRDTQITIPLGTSRANEIYFFQVKARKGGRTIGTLMTHGSNGHGWDYRFRVK